MRRDVRSSGSVRVERRPDQPMPDGRRELPQPMGRHIERGKRVAPWNADQAPVQTVGPPIVQTGQAGATAHRLFTRHESSTAMTACVEEHANRAAGVACHQQRQPCDIAGKHSA